MSNWKRESFTLAFLIFCSQSVLSYSEPVVNDRPIIGLLTQKTTPVLSLFGPTYLAASYVKYIESAGGRVVPILIDQPEEYYENLFNSINGLLFPGGSAGVQDQDVGYARVARILYDLAIKANDAGDFFPIWGTCLGFEDLMVLTAGEDLLIYNIDAHDITIPVTLQDGYQNSRLLGKSTTPKSIITTLTEEDSTYNSHKYAMTTTNFTKSPILTSFYQVLSTNHDLKGVEFVSTVEAKDYPIYGVQWHPEKNGFEWRVDACHTITCVELMQFTANFFVEEARKNDHHFKSSSAAAKALIYNFQPAYVAKAGISFEQAYFFTP